MCPKTLVMEHEEMNTDFINKIMDCISEYKLTVNEKQINEKVVKLKKEGLEQYRNKDIYKTLLSVIDLTTLNTGDNATRIKAFANKVNYFNTNYPDLNNVAAICTWPALIGNVKADLSDTSVKICSVAAGFPSAQTFPEVKIAETSLAIMDGADEIDIVINVGDLLDGNYDKVFDDISEVKSACGDAKLKVILETGALITLDNVRIASILALEAGADFIKTSTGKLSPAATPEAFMVMAQTLKEFTIKSKKQVGIKAAGGISTIDEALVYYAIVKEELADTWLNKAFFRIGASRLANVILSAIMDEEQNYFV